MKKLTLILKNVGNPDFRQDPSRKLPETENRKIKVSSFKEASEETIKYIEEFDLGSGNFPHAPILDETGKQIAYVSYNGRVWEGTDWEPGKKPIDI